MRVAIPSAMTVEATGGRENKNVVVSNGQFAVVLKGTKRPFREPGIDIREFAAVYDTPEFRKAKPALPVFDSNPEIIRVDTIQQRSADGRSAQPLDVAAMTPIENIVGVLQYEGGRYVIFTDVDKRPVFKTIRKPNAMPKLTETQFSVAGMNLENFFDDVDDPGMNEPVTPPEIFQNRLNKISRAIREYLRLPDVIGAIEVENINALTKLAERINADAVKVGLADPKYEAFLIEGNDGRGIDCGFLIKRSRVDVVEVVQFGKKDKYEHPRTQEELPLNDRPPLMARVSVKTSDGKGFPLTVVVNHLKSFLGYSDPKDMDNVRLKKRLQAEMLARFVSERQKADAAERMILLGDFNSFQFSDGILDLIGTIKGTPAAKDAVLNPSEDMVDPDLIDLVDVISPDERYSYVFDANAQTLDHMLITQNLKNYVKGFGFARLNADFPKILKNDPTRAERFSDHDPAVAYFTFQ
jgi:predicted extracellular nuclease